MRSSNKLLSIVAELNGKKKHLGGTLACILEDRLADLLVHGTVDSVEEFIYLVYADMKQDLRVDLTDFEWRPD